MKKILFLASVSLMGVLCINASSTTTAPAATQSAAVKASAGIAGAMKVVVPQKDLETAVRTSKEGDLLVYAGNDNWYHIDGKALQQGTRVFVLGAGSLVSVFPKEAEAEAVR
jgi:hypothetical protein